MSLPLGWKIPMFVAIAGGAAVFAVMYVMHALKQQQQDEERTRTQEDDQQRPKATQYMNDHDVSSDDRVHTVKQLGADSGNDPLFNNALAKENIPNLLCGLATQILDNRPEVQKSAIETLPDLFHNAMEIGDKDIAFRLKEVLNNTFQVLDDHNARQNHHVAKKAIDVVLDDMLKNANPESEARETALSILQMVTFGDSRPIKQRLREKSIWFGCQCTLSLNINLTIDAAETIADYSTDTKMEVDEVLVVIIAIGKYTDKQDINDVSSDLKHYQDILRNLYNYELMSSVDMKGNKGWKMSKNDVEKYVKEECLQQLLGGTRWQPNYNGLVVAFSCHGTNDSIICSDGETIKYSRIRRWFRSGPLMSIPRLFLVDSCRGYNKDGNEMKTSSADEFDAALIKQGDGDAPEATITAQREGTTVTGGKVAQYLCTEWKKALYDTRFSATPRYKTFDQLYKAAYKKLKQDTKDDKRPQTLQLSEYDPAIDELVLKPCSIQRDQETFGYTPIDYLVSESDVQRGDEHVAETDGSAPINDDELRNLLEPQADSTKNLMQYFFKLFNAGFIDNESLRKLTETDLDTLEITKKIDRRILLRRIRSKTTTIAEVELMENSEQHSSSYCAKERSASLNTIPGIIKITQSPNISISTTSDVGISSNFVFLED